MSKNCVKGKNCGGTCIENVDLCRLNLDELSSKALSNLASKVEQELTQSLEGFQNISTEKEAIDWLSQNYQKLAVSGMEGEYGAPGQRGTLDSDVWFLGQEAYSRPRRLYPDLSDTEIDNKVRVDPVVAVNHMRYEQHLYDRAPGYLRPEDRQSAVEAYIHKESGIKNYANLEKWAENDRSTYYFHMADLAKSSGFGGDVAGANISSFIQPSGQKTIEATAKMLSRNGVDPKTFAEGSLQNNSTWYRYSAERRAPYLLEKMLEKKPKLAYFGQQSKVDDKTASMNYMLYTLAKKAGSKTYSATLSGRTRKNGSPTHDLHFKWTKIGDTIVLNGFHATGQGISDKDRTFLKGLTKSLLTSGKPPSGVEYQEIPQKVIDRVLK